MGAIRKTVGRGNWLDVTQRAFPGVCTPTTLAGQKSVMVERRRPDFGTKTAKFASASAIACHDQAGT
jgi:hypothetical protein